MPLWNVSSSLLKYLEYVPGSKECFYVCGCRKFCFDEEGLKQCKCPPSKSKALKVQIFHFTDLIDIVDKILEQKP
jgi:hypothetical protein